MDAYRVFGVEAGASEAEILRRFRRLALQHHPDHEQDPALKAVRTAEMAEVIRAREILLDSSLRQKHDAALARRADRDQRGPAPKDTPRLPDFIGMGRRLQEQLRAHLEAKPHRPLPPVSTQQQNQFHKDFDEAIAETLADPALRKKVPPAKGPPRAQPSGAGQLDTALLLQMLRNVLLQASAKRPSLPDEEQRNHFQAIVESLADASLSPDQVKALRELKSSFGGAPELGPQLAAFVKLHLDKDVAGAWRVMEAWLWEASRRCEDFQGSLEDFLWLVEGQWAWGGAGPVQLLLAAAGPNERRRLLMGDDKELRPPTRTLYATVEEAEVDGLLEELVHGPHVDVDFLTCYKIEDSICRGYEAGERTALGVAFGYCDLFQAVRTGAQGTACLLNACMWLVEAAAETTNLVEQEWLLRTAVGFVFTLVNANWDLESGLRVYAARLSIRLLDRLIDLPGAEEHRTSMLRLAKLFTRVVVVHGRTCPVFAHPLLMASEVCLAAIRFREVETAFLDLLRDGEDAAGLPLPPEKLHYQLLHNRMDQGEPSEDLHQVAVAALLRGSGQPQDCLQTWLRLEAHMVDDQGFFLPGPKLYKELDKGPHTLLGLKVSASEVGSSIQLLADDSGPRLLSWEDVALASCLPASFLSFSLDPVDPLDFPHHPFNRVYVNDAVSGQCGEDQASLLAGSALLSTVYLADHLVKQMTTGWEVSYWPPHKVRPISRSRGIFAALPEELVEPLSAMARSSASAGRRHRFWIDVESMEMEEEGAQRADVKLSFGKVRMRLRFRRLVLNAAGELVDERDDDQEDLDEDSEEAKFCRVFTKHYDAIARGLPVFARLKELAKLLQVGPRIRARCLHFGEELPKAQVRLDAELVRATAAMEADVERQKADLLNEHGYGHYSEIDDKAADAIASGRASIRRQVDTEEARLRRFMGPFVDWMTACCRCAGFTWDQGNGKLRLGRTVATLWSPTSCNMFAGPAETADGSLLTSGDLSRRLVYGGVALGTGRVLPVPTGGGVETGPETET